MSIEEKSRRLAELIRERKKFFAAQRAEAIRNKPPTKTQRRNQMIQYLKNMAGYSHAQLKDKSFDEVQKLFEKHMKWINSFVPMEEDLPSEKVQKEVSSEKKAEGSSRKKSIGRKRAKDKQEQESSKRQRVEDDKEEEELKKCFELAKEEEIAINAIPLATKVPVVEEDFERVLWGDLRVMFEPDVESKAKEFKICSLGSIVSKQKQELMPFSIFTKLIVKYFLSKHDHISKRPPSFHHVIKLDSTLGNLKFVNKGSKEPIFGMAIPVVMLNDDIKASAKYSEYLAKSKRVTLVKTGGKGLLTKQGVEIAVERVSILRRRRSKTVTDCLVLYT
ncbi:hypothetical protein Tco_1531857 [Tanacetum coccineum]